MKKSLFALALCAFASQATAAAKPWQHPLQCVDVTAVKSSDTVPDIAMGIAHCLKEGKAKQAAELAQVFTAFGLYDVARVADKSAYGARDAAAKAAIDELGISQSQLAAIGPYSEQLLTSHNARQHYCQALHKLAPPSYAPNYMIAFGKHPQTPAIKADFKPKAAWQQAVKSAMCH